jgi:hypothetical protein
VAGVTEGTAWALVGAGVILVVGGAAWFIGKGAAEMMNPPSPPTPPQTPNPDRTKSEIDPDDVPDGSDENTIELPNAVALGEPPNGLDVDRLVTDVGDLAVDVRLRPEIGDPLPRRSACHWLGCRSYEWRAYFWASPYCRPNSDWMGSRCRRWTFRVGFPAIPGARVMVVEHLAAFQSVTVIGCIGDSMQL